MIDQDNSSAILKSANKLSKKMRDALREYN